MTTFKHLEGARLPGLTPNIKGFEAAIAAGTKEIAIFASASESFSKSNINCSIEESLRRYRSVSEKALNTYSRVRILCCWVPTGRTCFSVNGGLCAKQLYDMGCFETFLGDTTGVASMC